MHILLLIFSANETIPYFLLKDTTIRTKKFKYYQVRKELSEYIFCKYNNAINFKQNISATNDSTHSRNSHWRETFPNIFCQCNNKTNYEGIFAAKMLLGTKKKYLKDQQVKVKSFLNIFCWCNDTINCWTNIFCYNVTYNGTEASNPKNSQK